MLSQSLLRAIDAITEVAASGPTIDFYWDRLKSAPAEGHLTVSHLIDAHEACRRAGVIEIGNGVVRLQTDIARARQPSERRLAILDRLWSLDPPPWLAAQSPEVLDASMPDVDRDALVWTEAESADRDALLMGLGRKVDPRRLQRIGNEAEEAVLSAYEDLLNSQGGGFCEQVSKISDDLGYDLRIQTPRGALRVEVKAAAGTQRLRFFLTRNEAEVARRVHNWRIVICSRGELQGMMIAGHLFPDQLQPYLPRDPVTRGGSWEVCRIVIPAHELALGLPWP